MDELSAGGLCARLRRQPLVVAPGCFDALSALLIERAGFECAYLSGASIAYTKLGQPDLGLFGLETLRDAVCAIRERVSLPLIVDADTGFGNALNVQRTFRALEACGADAIQLEDQQMPKRCGHLRGKLLVSTEEMVGKIHAACDARRSFDTGVIARTDAVAVEGLEAALERAERYIEAGADILFVEALPDMAAILTTVERFANRIPLLANIVEGGRTPMLDTTELSRLGFSLAIYPGALVRAQAAAALECLEILRTDGSTNRARPRMLNFSELNDLLGTEVLIQRASQYDAEALR